MTPTTCQYCGHDCLLDGCEHAQDENGNVISCAHCPKALAEAMGMASQAGSEPATSAA